ncbi:carotenoid biosynthesis protein [Nitrogeniibacter mangrovi]|uniref:Carotenoid biosynthesis protein n=1 Tax=Nitrogeniibacter mangrovi TaxID=2016596 RepID=A0A6C1AYE7_9RHOO|nr:carotenoid biosynthesis protein [Nitrogeniibacter mangrovi]QID16376.1 carotenoid biosynthesis protein [Nitrogeniibacter mangrovi]
MHALTPSTDFLVLQSLNYLLTVFMLVHAWRRQRGLLWVIPAAIVFGFLIEYSQVSKAVPPYRYTQALVALPGPVPLGVVLSWGTIIYAVLATVRTLRLSPWVLPIVAGLLATAIDFVSDPAFVSLDFWVWAKPGDWFGIPWTNYVGWFVIVAGYAAWFELLLRRGPARPAFRALAPWLAVPLAFGSFMAVMIGYLWVESLAIIDPTMLVAAFFGLWLMLAIRPLLRAPADVTLDPGVLAPPLFLYGASLFILFATGLHHRTPALALVLPVFALFGLSGFLWPARGRLGLHSLSGGAGSGRRRHLLAAMVLAMAAGFGLAAMHPHKGLIGPVTLPGDDAFLPDQDVQWWYWTGHLETAEGRRFGFEVVFFSFDSFLFMRDQLTQVAITDVAADRFRFGEHLKFHLPRKTDKRFDLNAGPHDIIRAVGDDRVDRIHSEVGGYVLDLEMQATKPTALHYGGDAHPYRFGGYTYYYSRVRMATRGTITVDGKTYHVTGTSWYDRQYGELYQAIVKGWQWFAIELDDNRQIMLYDILGKSNRVERAGSITDAEGHTRPIMGDQFQVEVLGHWKSPHTGCTYPSGWRVTVEGQTYEVQPMVQDQELRAKHGFWPGPEYWEGAATVGGDNAGKAYVELNGFCRSVEGTVAD